MRPSTQMMNRTFSWIATLPVLFLAAPAQASEQDRPKSGAAVTRAGGDSAEVEITGTLKASTRPQKLIAFVSTDRCDPKKGATDALRSVIIDANVSMNFFLEIFVPQGSTGHVCGAGYDKDGKVVLFGAYPGNPLTFRGKGEVTFSQVTVPLEPLPKQPRSGKPSVH